ncbi:MAG TPA: hypothetical protein DEP18_07465 [Flavobacteriales bacterium]|nr:hypothetical protein [Flavobacteriales bacterium]
MFYLYILYSASADKYYVGYTGYPWRRVQEHNENDGSTFTGKCFFYSSIQRRLIIAIE